MWPEDYARQGELVVPEAILYLKGKVDRRGREPNVVVNKLMTLDDADKEFTKQLAIRFQRGLHAESELVRVREILDRYPGETDVMVIIDSADPKNPQTRLRYQLAPPQRMRVSCSSGLRRDLAAILGDENLSLVPTNGARKNGNGHTNGNGH
jgi:DNA polymerase-3 subunit alpha